MTLLELAQKFDAANPEDLDMRLALALQMTELLGNRSDEMDDRYDKLVDAYPGYPWPAETIVRGMSLVAITGAPKFYGTGMMCACGCAWHDSQQIVYCDAHLGIGLVPDDIPDEMEIAICHMASEGAAYPKIDALITELTRAREAYGADAHMALVSGRSAFDRTYLVVSHSPRDIHANPASCDAHAVPAGEADQALGQLISVGSHAATVLDRAGEAQMASRLRDAICLVRFADSNGAVVRERGGPHWKDNLTGKSAEGTCPSCAIPGRCADAVVCLEGEIKKVRASVAEAAEVPWPGDTSGMSRLTTSPEVAAILRGEESSTPSVLTATLHERGGPLPTLPNQPLLAKVIQFARGRVHAGDEPMEIARQALDRLTAKHVFCEPSSHDMLDPEDVRILIGYLLMAAESKGRQDLMRDQKTARIRVPTSVAEVVLRNVDAGLAGEIASDRALRQIKALVEPWPEAVVAARERMGPDLFTSLFGTDPIIGTESADAEAKPADSKGRVDVIHDRKTAGIGAWRAVTDDAPGRHEEVVGRLRDGSALIVERGSEAGRWYVANDDGCLVDTALDVAWWMPIPPPPEADTKTDEGSGR